MGVTLNYKIVTSRFIFLSSPHVNKEEVKPFNTCQTHCAIDKSRRGDILANQIGSNCQRLHQHGRRPNAVQNGQTVNASHIVTLENCCPNGGDNGDKGAKKIGPILSWKVTFEGVNLKLAFPRYFGSGFIRKEVKKPVKY